jgi:hypothetical protein
MAPNKHMPIKAVVLARPFDAVAASKSWAILVLAFLCLTLASVAERVQSPISCERHQGAFGNGFSPAFDINSVDCRVSWIQNSQTVRFWGVYPFVGIKQP